MSSGNFRVITVAFSWMFVEIILCFYVIQNHSILSFQWSWNHYEKGENFLDVTWDFIIIIIIKRQTMMDVTWLSKFYFCSYTVALADMKFYSDTIVLVYFCLVVLTLTAWSYGFRSSFGFASIFCMQQKWGAGCKLSLGSYAWVWWMTWMKQSALWLLTVSVILLFLFSCFSIRVNLSIVPCGVIQSPHSQWIALDLKLFL